MDIAKIKNNLRFATPTELYDIAPGQVVYFASKDGLCQFELIILADLLRYFRQLHKYNDIKLSIVPTDNELLIGTFAGRNPEEIDIPYKVVVSTWDTAAGFASQYFGEDIKEIVDREVKVLIASHIKITTDLPAIVEIDPENRPSPARSIEEQIESSYDSGFDMGLKIAKPEKGSLAEKKLISKEEKKLEKILRECAVLGIELDIDRIKEKVANDLKKRVDYKLIIKKQRNNLRNRTIEYNTYDIYVAEGEEYKLDLTGIHKAVYLAYLLYKDGLRVEDTFGEFREITKKIYGHLPFADKNEKLTGGIRDAEGTTFDAYTKTLRGYFTNIRDAISDKVSDPLVAQDFAIEGFKGAPFGIAKTTPEIIAQIKEDFWL